MSFKILINVKRNKYGEALIVEIEAEKCLEQPL